MYGSISIGIDDKIDGIASIDLRPDAYEYLYVIQCCSKESRNGVYPLYSPFCMCEL